ncbi:preprotein translocase subunit SecA [Flindersiella endophytica]
MPVLIDKMLHAGEGRTLKRMQNIAKQVNAIEEDFARMTDAELRGMTDEFKQRLADGETLDDILPEAFAAFREASKRTIGKRHFDVQLTGAAALHKGYIAEMKTGEGKTFVSGPAAYLNALEGKGVHVVTVNDYLAQYQGELMGRVHHFLGLTVDVILAHMTPAERRVAYAADITYGTNNEFGFDYLRDNMAGTLEECVQRGHNFAVVDEVDSILIDEARTPLIISGPASDQDVEKYAHFANLAAKMRKHPPRQDHEEILPDYDYEVDPKQRTIGVLEPAIDKVEDFYGIDNLYEAANTTLVQYLNNAIRAKELFTRDKDYVVMDNEVLIVDEHTGRMLHGRRYNEGLHQAIEAKEGVAVQGENQTLATITLQNYFRLYSKLSGMTGTAKTEESEFNKIYGVGVMVIPTNRPMIRKDQPDKIFRTPEAKFAAVVKDIAERHATGQPVLVGTTSVEQSELLAHLLKRTGVKHEVLNAKQHAREAAIVAEAGRLNAVTVATNMAGRGTDIMLGGNSEFLADAELRQHGLDPVDTPDEYERAWLPTLERIEKAVAAEHDQVVQLGGLYVVGTERHDSRRIDNQLRGRSGRQGDPGESRFYLSLGDELMRRFRADWVERVLTFMNIPDDQPIEDKRVTKMIANVQAQVESMHFESRKQVLKYDDVLNRQRHVIYGERRTVLEGEDVHDQVVGFIDDAVADFVTGATQTGYVEEWDLDQLWNDLKGLYPLSLDLDELEERAGGRGGLTAEFLTEELQQDAQEAYRRREAEFGSDLLRDIERQVILFVLDHRWREHLYEMDYLREGIGLRAYAQRDPLVEYQREGFELFEVMMDAIKEESVRLLFNAPVQRAEPTIPEDGQPVDGELPADHPHAVLQGLSAPRTPAQLSYSAPTIDGEGGVIRRTERNSAAGDGADGDIDFSGTPRNAPCPCGSGRKYKRCHGDPKVRARMQ